MIYWGPLVQLISSLYIVIWKARVLHKKNVIFLIILLRAVLLDYEGNLNWTQVPFTIILFYFSWSWRIESFPSMFFPTLGWRVVLKLCQDCFLCYLFKLLCAFTFSFAFKKIFGESFTLVFIHSQYPSTHPLTHIKFLGIHATGLL